MSRIDQIEEAVAAFGDIAYQGNGQWTCWDTGITYTNSEIAAMVKPAPVKAPAKPLSEKARAARVTAKKSGMKALKGSAAQKEWAEKIRASKISIVSRLPEVEQREALEAVALLTTAKFWIENRDREIIHSAVKSLRARRAVDEACEARNLFIMLEEQKLGNFGMGFNTGRWPAEAQKRFHAFSDEIRALAKDII